MHINRIKIDEFRVLENLKIEFQVPDDKKNIINVIAGVNGSGKTSLLTLIKTSFTLFPPLKIKWVITLNDNSILYPVWEDAPKGLETEACVLNKYLAELKKNNQWIDGQHTSSRLIYSPAKLAFEYKQSATINTTYEFYNEINTHSLLGDAEYYIREYVISKERQSRETEPKLRTQQAVAEFNKYFSCVEMSTILYDLDIHKQNKPIFKNSKGDLISIDQLSDGEKQLYGRVISLMILNPVDSIIMIDEPEISLHPSWQLAIMKIYAQIGEGNQFIVATHSPQIIANTPYENLILLNKNTTTGKIQATKASTPSGADVNSILQEVMGADSMPKEQMELYKEYRQFVEQEKENSDKASEVRKQILKRENENSEFLQEMNFIIELRNL